MAKARVLERRRRTIQNIRKITRTMELISTAQFKRAMNRAGAAGAFARQLNVLRSRLAGSALYIRHPLLQPPPERKRTTLLVLSSNRGLCGGYNAAVVRLALTRHEELHTAGQEVRLEVVGKRGFSAFRHRRIPVAESFTHFTYRPAFAEVDVLAVRYLDDYLHGLAHCLEVVFTPFRGATPQAPTMATLLPLSGFSEAESRADADRNRFEFLPAAEELCRRLLPTVFKFHLYQCFLEAAAAEQLARMTAMKAATENADEMIARLSVAYNRARQGQITGELLEIIGGAEAINE